jgi:hypothetical protein
MRAIIFIVTAGLVATAAATSVDADIGGVRIETVVSNIRFGGDICRTYLVGYESYRKGLELDRFIDEVNWVGGAVSAVQEVILGQTATADDLGGNGGIDDEALVTWLATYCGAHPNDTMRKAGIALGSELVDKAKRR